MLSARLKLIILVQQGKLKLTYMLPSAAPRERAVELVRGGTRTALLDCCEDVVWWCEMDTGHYLYFNL